MTLNATGVDYSAAVVLNKMLTYRHLFPIIFHAHEVNVEALDEKVTPLH